MKIKILAIVMAVVLVAVCAVIVIVSTSKPTQPSTSGEAVQNDSQGTSDEVLQGNSQGTEQNGAEGASDTDTSDPEDTEPTDSSANAASSEGEEPQPTESENNSTTPSNTQTPTEKEESASYENHLAALTLFALSMEYPDFSLEGIYTASSVQIADKASSKGIYAVFTSGDEKITVHVYPIADERTESGTRDVYAAELGFAAFDIVEKVPDGVDAMEQSVYATLFSVLNGISLYTH